jgi:hypothetical protein
MAAVAMSDAWMETCLISIAKIGGSDMQFAGLTETVEIDIGDKDIEGVALVNGGRVTKWKPEDDTTINFEAYPIQAGTDTGTTGKGFFDLRNTVDTSVPIRVLNDRNRDKYRVLVLWTNDTTVTSAHSATTANYSGLRIGAADGYFTSVKPSFTDGILKWKISFKTAPFDKSGVANLMVESAAGSTGSDVLPAVAAYTTTNKFS